MQKNSITNKITPCCGLPFSVVYWWVSNLTLNSESDRQFILSKISQNGILSIDGWKVLINSGTLEADASLTKPDFLAWFDCGKQPNCEQLKLIIEGYKMGNWIGDLNEIRFENVLGTLKITDAAPTAQGLYRLADVGTYTNLGGLVTTDGKINDAFFDGSNWSLISISLLSGLTVFDENNETMAGTMKVTADYIKSKLAAKVKDVTGDNLFEFVDKQNKRFAYFDSTGKFVAILSDSIKADLKELKEDSSDDVYRLIDGANRMVLRIDKDGFLNAKIKDLNPNKTSGLSMLSRYPFDAEKGVLSVESMTMIASVIDVDTTAKGRNSTSSTTDAPTTYLGTNGGAAHPSVLYFPQKWNGKKYWMAFTPYFGIINVQSDYSAYENPHIMCSDDGINWEEPVDHFGVQISNPIDQPSPTDWCTAHSSFNYWSDTHLEIGDDNYLYCYYRGNYIPFPTITDNYIVAFTVVRKSKDGVHWSAPELVKSTNDSDLDNNSGIVSQAIVNNSGTWSYFDIAFSTTAHPYTADNAQTGKFTFRTTGNSYKNFDLRDSNHIVRFDSRPWGASYEPWHIDVKKYGNLYFMLICAGSNGVSHGDALYLAYSGDGWNWTCLPDVLFTNNTYRSSIVLKDFNGDVLTFWIYRGRKDNGKIELHELKLKYNN